MVSELNSMLRNSSDLSASSRRPEDVKMLSGVVYRTRYDVENTLGTTNYSFSLLLLRMLLF